MYGIMKNDKMDINVLDKDNKTCLLYAVETSDEECVKQLLLKKNINPNIQDKLGDTALIKACNIYHYR